MSELRAQTKVAPEIETEIETETTGTTFIPSESQYNTINHTKRATSTNLKLPPGSTFTTHLLTHIHNPTSTWPTLSTLLLDPAYHHDDLCPASDLIAACEATFHVFTNAANDLAKVLDGVEGFKVKRTPGQLGMMRMQFERYIQPRLEEAKEKVGDEKLLSKAEVRKWIMGFMSARDGALEDLGRWKRAFGSGVGEGEAGGGGVGEVGV